MIYIYVLKNTLPQSLLDCVGSVCLLGHFEHDMLLYIPNDLNPTAKFGHFEMLPFVGEVRTIFRAATNDYFDKRLIKQLLEQLID